MSPSSGNSKNIDYIQHTAEVRVSETSSVISTQQLTIQILVVTTHITYFNKTNTFTQTVYFLIYVSYDCQN